MPTKFSERIIDYMKQPGYQPMRPKKLARALGIASGQMGDFHDAVDALRRMGRVVLGSNSAITLPDTRNQIVGTYRGNPRGFGFVVPNEDTAHGDLYIPEGESGGAITGDTVRCRVFRRGKRDGKMSFGGSVLEIVERGHSQFVGQLQKDGEQWYVEPDGKILGGPIFIGDPGAKSAQPEDHVVVEITRYPQGNKPAQGVIVERLGPHSEPGVDLVSVCRQFHLPDTFPDEVLDETRGLARAFDVDAEAERREVIDDRTIITIDPDDARDFDDAISLEKLDAGAEAKRKRAKKSKGKRKGPAVWELGVHIADVSHFVKPGSHLDVEAYKRGTSVYLPGKVIPMLPEILSNGLCSLQEAEPRLCKSAFIRYDAAGRVVSAHFANTVIKSDKRLTYGEATAILDGKTRGFPKVAVELVKRMNELAIAIRKRRLSDGMIVLNLPDVDLILNENGEVTGAEPEDTSFSHTIIEMFMVEANEAVARHLKKLKTPYLRRIHPDPDEASLEAMAKFVRAVGIDLPYDIEPQDIQELLTDLRARPEGYAVNLAVLKSMQMAEYSAKEIGHFALASENYSHFTSPIRRYPDLMIHRLLDLDFAGLLPLKKGAKKTPKGWHSEDSLFDAGNHLSYLSRRAESAERELKSVKILKLLQDQVGEDFEGVVTGVTSFGLFVQHPMYLLDGLLRIEDLGDDWWEVNVKGGRIEGERSGITFRLGSKLKVRIAEIDVPNREMKLVPVDVETDGEAPSVQPRPFKRKGRGRKSKADAGRGRGSTSGRGGKRGAKAAKGKRGSSKPRAKGKKAKTKKKSKHRKGQSRGG